MDLKELIAKVQPDDIEKIEALLPLLKQRARLDEALSVMLSGQAAGMPMASKAEPKAPKPTGRRGRKPGQRPARLEAIQGSALKSKAATKVPLKGAMSMMEAAEAFVRKKGKSASVAEIMDAVASAKGFRLTAQKKNVIKSSLYNSKRFKKVGPGLFALR